MFKNALLSDSGGNPQLHNSYVQYFTSTFPGTRPCMRVSSLFYSCFGHCYAHTFCVPRNPVIFVEPSPVIAILPLSAAAAAFFPTQDILNPLRSCSAPGGLVLRWTLKADTYGQIILRTLMYTVCDKTILISRKDKYCKQ